MNTFHEPSPALRHNPPLYSHTAQPRDQDPHTSTTQATATSPAEIQISLHLRHLTIHTRVVARRDPRLAHRHAGMPRLDVDARIQVRVKLGGAGGIGGAEVENVGGLRLGAGVAVG